MRTALISIALFAPSAVFAQTPYTSITTPAGPLTAIHAGDEGSVQVAHIMDGTTHEFYPPDEIPGDSGTFLVVGGVLYAPNFDVRGSATGNIGVYTAFTPISQSMVMGTGTSTAPYRLITVFAAGTTGLTITHTDVYVAGEESYLTNVAITNSGTIAQSVVLYRAADCFLGGSDSGYGVQDILTGAIGCAVNADNVPAGRIEQWLPISPGSSFYQSRYSSVWSWIGTHAPFPNTCDCTIQQDNGAGISWAFTVAPGATETRSHITTFSPLGSLPLTMAKSADTATVTAGSNNGYTVVIDNRNPFNVNVTNVVDVLPAGFSYVPGSTSGALTADPIVAGQTLTWTATISVPALGASMFHFNVVVGTATGTFYNNIGGSAAGAITVSPSGNTAPINVIAGATPDAGVGDGSILDDAGEGADGPSIDDDAAVAPDGSAEDAAAGEDAEASDGAADPDAGVASDAAPNADAASNNGDASGGPADTGSGGSRSDAGGTRDDGDGCGCTVSQRDSGGSPWMLLALGVLWLVRRSRNPRD